MWAHDEWTEDDRLLAVAYRLHRDGLCPCGCGYPRSQTWSEDMDGWYEAREVTCYARAAREAWERDRRDSKAELEPGTLLVIDDTRHTSR